VSILEKNHIMKYLFVFLLLGLVSCGDDSSVNERGKSKKKKSNANSLTERAIDFQNAYRTFEFDAIEPYLSSGSIDFTKKFWSDENLEANKTELSKKYKEKGSDNYVIKSKIYEHIDKNYNKEKRAKITQCCNGWGEEFETFWVRENNTWKVDFFTTMQVIFKNKMCYDENGNLIKCD